MDDKRPERRSCWVFDVSFFNNGHVVAALQLYIPSFISTATYYSGELVCVKLHCSTRNFCCFLLNGHTAVANSWSVWCTIQKLVLSSSCGNGLNLEFIVVCLPSSGRKGAAEDSQQDSQTFTKYFLLSCYQITTTTMRSGKGSDVNINITMRDLKFAILYHSLVASPLHLQWFL